MPIIIIACEIVPLNVSGPIHGSRVVVTEQPRIAERHREGQYRGRMVGSIVGLGTQETKEPLRRDACASPSCMHCRRKFLYLVLQSRRCCRLEARRLKGGFNSTHTAKEIGRGRSDP